LYDQKEAVTPFAQARRSALALARIGTLALMAVLLLFGAAGALMRDEVRAAAPSAPRSPDATLSSPGYLVMDLPAIKRALRGGRGHALLVHFWASWCAPCLEELPVMEKFAREMKPRGLEVLSLSLDDPERGGARAVNVLTEIAPSLTRFIVKVDDTDAFISTFDTRWEGAIPALFAYDSQGQLRGRLIGEATRRDLDNLVARFVKSGPK
jgi:thiol-disulfide isomerase/thioredoxin